MANPAGFNAPVKYWGTIANLLAKSSADNKATNYATALNSYGDVAGSDVYGETLNPSVEYVVTGDFTNTNNVIRLGMVKTFDNHKYMITQVEVETSAGNHPVVRISGIQVPDNFATVRMYPVPINLLARARAQDVAGAFSAHAGNFTSVNTTYKIDGGVQTVAGDPVFCDAANGVIEVNATLVLPDGELTYTLASGFNLTSSPVTSPDADFMSAQLTATKHLAGTDA